jgi:hypothetical protein
VLLERLSKWITFDGLNLFGTRDLPACSTVPKPTELPHVPAPILQNTISTTTDKMAFYCDMNILHKMARINITPLGNDFRRKIKLPESGDARRLIDLHQRL